MPPEARKSESIWPPNGAIAATTDARSCPSFAKMISRSRPMHVYAVISDERTRAAFVDKSARETPN